MIEIKLLGPTDPHYLNNVAKDVFDDPILEASAQEFLNDPRHRRVVALDNDGPVLFEILRTYRPAPKTALYCPKPAPTRLKADEYAYVNTDLPVSYNNVREAPGVNQTLIGRIEPGRSVELLEGPVCNNSLQWWKVRVSTTLEGWTPEGDHKKYWLNPCESKENCGAP